MPRRVKRPVFVACEGKSETGYIRWLDRLADAHDVPVAIKAQDLKGGPIEAILENAVIQFKRASAGGKVYRKKFVIFDIDNSKVSADQLGQIEIFSKRNKFGLIRQDKCHDCFLLKHFRNTAQFDPHNAKTCLELLLRQWPAYRKGLDALAYKAQLTHENLAYARGRVDDLNNFFDAIGWN